MSLTNVLHNLFRQERGGPRGQHTTLAHSTPRASLLFLPKHTNWPPVCDAKAPMTAFGKHSLVPAFYANWAAGAPRAHTASEAPPMQDQPQQKWPHDGSSRISGGGGGRPPIRLELNARTLVWAGVQFGSGPQHPRRD